MAISARVRFAIFARDDFRCRYCGTNATSSPLEVDHVKPRARDGSDDSDNLVTACVRCNAGKSAHPLPSSSFDSGFLTALHGVWHAVIDWRSEPPAHFAVLVKTLLNLGYEPFHIVSTIQACAEEEDPCVDFDLRVRDMERLDCYPESILG